MSDVAEATESTKELLAVLELKDWGARTREDIFTCGSHLLPSGRVYGGQVLAQSLVAAQRTVPADRVLHSMHGYFLRPGHVTRDITLSVDRIHDGRSFARRRSQAYQNGVPIFSMIASFQDQAAGIEHALPMPSDVPAPEELPTEDFQFLELTDARRQLAAAAGPLEIRRIDRPLPIPADAPQQLQQNVWIRVRSPLPDDPALHQAALAYLSDMTIQESVLRLHSLNRGRPGVKIASLDHAMWWHRLVRADEWLLYVQESPSAEGGRGLATGRLYSRDGVLAATVAQEIMVRGSES